MGIQEMLGIVKKSANNRLLRHTAINISVKTC